MATWNPNRKVDIVHKTHNGQLLHANNTTLPTKECVVALTPYGDEPKTVWWGIRMNTRKFFLVQHKKQ